MSFFTDSEKIEYALKYALNVTMQNKSLSPYAEEKAPKRIFPRNIMSKDLIEKDKGDLDVNGKYVENSAKWVDSANKITANLKDPQSTVEYYKIVDPVTNVVSNVTVRDILGNPNIVGMKQATIDGLSESLSSSDDLTTTAIQQCRQKWFFRGHYQGQNDDNKFNNATTLYNGLSLAYSHITSGTQLSKDSNGDLSDNQVATHIKLYLQVQTQNIAAGRDSTGDVDNISFRHSSMENILGLESGFTNVVPVQGPKYIGDNDVLPIIQTGEMGNEWFTQDTYGMLSFYALGSGGKELVSETPEPDTADVATTGAPLISFLRYVGETASTTGIGGGGGGSGGGSGGGVNLTEFTGGAIVRSDGNSINKPTNILAMLENTYTPSKIGTENVMDLSLNLTGDLKLEGNGTTGGNIRLPDNGKIFIGTNEAVFSNWETKSSDIYKNSKVGIGDFSSATIDAPLHVVGDLKLTGAIVCSNEGTTDDVLKKTASGGMEWGTIASGKWSGATGGIHYSGGNVGIGTTSPVGKLQVNSASNGSNTEEMITLQNTYGNSYSSNIVFRDYNPVGGTQQIVGKIGTKYNSSMMNIVFSHLYNNGPKTGEAMRICGNGNVGIGTTTPEKYYLNSNAIGGSYSSTETILAIHGGTSGQNNGVARLVLACDANHTASIFAKHTGSGNTHMGFFTTSTTNAPTEKMRIDSAGNVGIGTTSPDDKLHITGGNLRIENSGSDSLDSKIIFEESGYNDRFFIATDLKNWAASDQHLRFGFTTDGDSGITNSNVLLNIAGNGNVGIGTTTPKTALQIGYENTGSGDGIGGWGVYNVEEGSLSILNNDASSGTDTKTIIDMVRWGKSSYAYGTRCQIKLGRYTTASSGAPYDANTRLDFDLLDGYSDASLNNVMSLQANGNVGIGTTSPEKLLDVNGDTKIDGDLILSGNISDSKGNTLLSNPINRNIKSYQYKNWITADHWYPRATRDGWLVLYKDCLYQTGGEGSGRNDQVYKYSFTTNKWTQEVVISAAQAYHSAGCVYKGKLFIWGGYLSNYYYNDMWAYDFDSKTWTTEISSDTNMAGGRYGQCGARKDNIFYYFGGRNSSGGHHNDLWYINLDNYNDRGLVNGGNVGSTLPPTRRGATMAYYNECLYLFGGSGKSDLWKFDLLNNVWQEITMVGNEEKQQTGWQARYAESPLIGNEMIIIYGFDGAENTQNYHIYSINLDTYHYRKLISTDARDSSWYRRDQTAACVVGDKIYCWGGHSGSTLNSGIIFTFNRSPYINRNHEIIQNDKFKTYSWSMFKRYAKTKGGDLPTAEYIKSNYEEFVVKGQDIWLPCYVKNYKENWYSTSVLNIEYDSLGVRDWIQIGDLNHPYGRIHSLWIDNYYGSNISPAYPTWGDDNYTSYDFRKYIVIVYDTGANIGGDLRVSGLIEGNQPYHWVCEIESENADDGVHGGEPGIAINGKWYIGGRLIAWRIDPKTGKVLSRIGHQYLYSGGSWNTLADEINSLCNNGDVICITSSDYIRPCPSSGSGYDLLTSAGIREAFNLPNGRVCYCAAFIKGCYGSIEKRGRSGSDNIKIRFSYLDLLNITDQKYIFNSTETTTAGGNNAYFGTLSINDKVGIGTTSPSATLHLGSGNIRINYNSTSYLNIDHNQINRTGGALYFNHGSGNNIIMDKSKLCIGTASIDDYEQVTIAGKCLRVHGYYYSNGTGSAGKLYSGGTTTSGGEAADISILADKAIYCYTNVYAGSDRRIKKEIEDVPDDDALRKLNEIEVNYYKYIDDRTRGNERQIGFIAQQVRDVFPLAVSLKSEFVPNVYVLCENFTFTSDGDKFNFVCDEIPEQEGKYKFICSDSGDDGEHEIKIQRNDDNSFTFEKEWDNIFCFGYEVDDMHILDKQKLFALNFSATQELYRQQQADKVKIAELESKNQTLENEVATLKSELTAIKSHLGI